MIYKNKDEKQKVKKVLGRCSKEPLKGLLTTCKIYGAYETMWILIMELIILKEVIRTMI